MRQGLQARKTDWITLLVVGVAVPAAATCGYWVARWGKMTSFHRPSDPMHWAYVSVGWGFVASILLGVVLFVVCLIRGQTRHRLAVALPGALLSVVLVWMIAQEVMLIFRRLS
jgi:hypothetical protein